jgi:hypothetical protein
MTSIAIPPVDNPTIPVHFISSMVVEHRWRRHADLPIGFCRFNKATHAIPRHHDVIVEQ